MLVCSGPDFASDSPPQVVFMTGSFSFPGRDLIKKSAMVKGVFGSGVQGIRYDLNYYEAERLCQLSGATLASYAQLRAAWHANFGYCR